MTTLDKLRELDAQTSPEPWTVDDIGQETQYVYGTITRDHGIGYAIYARSSDGTCPRIAWIHSVDPEMVQQSRANAQLIVLSKQFFLPAMEALKRLVSGSIPSEVVGASDARDILVKLEEALNE